jgi:hypothetical protein
MKRYLPFVFPAIAIIILLVLGYRWFSLQTDRAGTISQFGEGVEIEDLNNNASASSMIRGSKDYKSVDLQGEGEAMGQVRYENKEGKVTFMVTANLPELTAGEYQVWLKSPTSEEVKKAFVLEMNKGGYTGTGAVSAELLPFEVIVSEETRPDMTLEKVLLRGTINKE